MLNKAIKFPSFTATSHIWDWDKLHVETVKGVNSLQRLVAMVWV